MKIFFGTRIIAHRWRRALAWWLQPQCWATMHGDGCLFPRVVAERSSPLQRAPDGAIAAHTDEKTHNLRLGCAKVNGLVLMPGQVFSFCRTVGQTTTHEGYLPALELHDGVLTPAVGGGLCQLSNLLLLLALDINAEIVERHRHSYDLFRDVDRTVPFGCGATVFYNYVDFQFRNRLPFPIYLQTTVEPPLLRGRILTDHPLPFHITIEETDHRFFREGKQIYRANRIWRRVEWRDDHEPECELVFENVCRVLYPAEDLV
jgi:vancomycin resistance protein VanW